MERCEAGEFEHPSRDVCPQPHGTERRLAAALPQRRDVQTRHLVLHLRGTEEGTKVQGD